MSVEAAPIAARVTRLTRALRDAGVAVGIDGSIRFAEALRLVDTTAPERARCAARATLVHRREDFEIFDRVFDAVWLGVERRGLGQAMPMAPRHDPSIATRTALVSFMAERAREDAKEIEVGDRTGSASPDEQLLRRDFARMSPDELEATKRALRDLRWPALMRRTRRTRADRRGDRLDLRAAAKKCARHGGIVLELPRRAAKSKQRPIVLLADISGSMELYSRVLLTFFHGLSQGLRDVETFVFGTRLTRITTALELRDPDAALDAVAWQVVDFAGGTRIGASLEAFDRKWRRRVLGRGAVVIVVSDGLDTGDPDRLERALARLAVRCHRLIWLNPLLGGRHYEPRAKGMARALAYVDDFLPAHDLESLRGLAAHLAALPERGGRRITNRYRGTSAQAPAVEEETR